VCRRSAARLRSTDVPEYRYLVVGAGMAGDSACRGIRDHDEEGSIGLVGAEPHEPYARPPLSKALWKGGKSEESIMRGTRELGVSEHTGRRVVELDVDARTATDGSGETYSYERVVITTGGTPRRLPSDVDGVIYFRTLDDYRLLRSRAGDGVRAIVIGGGFIGSELAAALNTAGCSVSMLFPDDGIGARIFPPDLATFVSEYYAEKGVDVLPGELVEAVERDGEGFRVTTKSGRTLDGDVVVAGLGIVPNTDLGEQAGLEVDDGIIVDEYGRAGGREDVYAAGDVARFPVPVLGGTRRVEHEDHANTHGREVGANLAGAGQPYDYLPFFYSDLFDLGYEAVGDTDPQLTLTAEWAEPNRKGVVCYSGDDGKPRGFLLWDVWDKVDAARALIRAGEPVSAETLRGLLG
jgi:3-phenylpropionate/trans-cinnamate dioxygenase ferredoxin reductase subunit